MKLAVAAAAALAAANMTADGGMYEKYEFKGLEKPVYYLATGPIDAGSDCELAVVHVHGWGGGIKISKESVPMLKALRAALRDGAPGPYVISPMFPRRLLLDKAKVPADGRAVWNVTWSKSLSVPGHQNDDWRGGGDAQGTHLSSYDVIDLIFKTLGDKALFPNLKRVVLTGYSAGGQFVGRYAAVGKGEMRDGVELEYAAMAPSTELRLDPDVRWHYGIKDRPRYSAQLTREQMLKNLSSRRVWRACGTADVKVAPFTSLDSCPEAMAQGANRYERFKNFEQYLKQFPEWAAQVSFYSLEGVGHENAFAHSSAAFIKYAVGKLGKEAEKK